MIEAQDLHQLNMRRAFDQAVLSYDKHAILQEHVGQQLISFIGNKHYYPRVIDLGCGTGLSTQLLERSIKYRNFYALDLAPELLKLASIRLSPLGVHTSLANFENPASLQGHYDLIFSNMSLHWSQHWQNTLAFLYDKLNLNGVLAFSIPLHGTFKELENHFNIRKMPSHQEIRETLITSGADSLIFKHETYQLCFKNTLDALRSIRSTGATYVPDKKITGLGRKAALLETNIQKLSYEIAYFIVIRTSA